MVDVATLLVKVVTPVVTQHINSTMTQAGKASNLLRNCPITAESPEPCDKTKITKTWRQYI